MIRPTHLTAAAVALCVTGTVPADIGHAQTPAAARLCGTVRADESGSGLAGATVRVYRFIGQQQQTREVTTAPDGSFCVTGLAPTFYRVSISKQGYMRLRDEPITLSPGQTREMSVRLGVYVRERVPPPDPDEY